MVSRFELVTIVYILYNDNIVWYYQYHWPSFYVPAVSVSSRQAWRPSVQVYSALGSSSDPHFPDHAAPGAQQVRPMFPNATHLGHIAAVAVECYSLKTRMGLILKRNARYIATKTAIRNDCYCYIPLRRTLWCFLQAWTPSSQVWSAPGPHFRNQVPPTAQQLRSSFGYVPHKGHVLVPVVASASAAVEIFVFTLYTSNGFANVLSHRSMIRTIA